eukprot:TRINITY_DN4358_c0_g1_i2.p1 TRINITY_DN4358_c0_g1~~TRINITY_DN4358_c0_g1_i2.p1  ORF type:complete len:138 (-),score=13.56 TRINITY_DN4358_c0_g1_i2:91-504(-)
MLINIIAEVDGRVDNMHPIVEYKSTGSPSTLKAQTYEGEKFIIYLYEQQENAMDDKMQKIIGDVIFGIGELPIMNIPRKVADGVARVLITSKNSQSSYTCSVSYTHLTLPTICSVQISVVAVSLKKKIKQTTEGAPQ